MPLIINYYQLVNDQSDFKVNWSLLGLKTVTTKLISKPPQKKCECLSATIMHRKNGHGKGSREKTLFESRLDQTPAVPM